MKKSLYSLLIALLVISQGAIGQNKIDLSAPIPVNKELKTGTLPNGLKYYIRYNQKPANRVELRLVVNAGSVLEDDAQQGMAHFMEHMNFNGLKHFPANEIVKYLQSIGVEFGNDLNAYTSFDQTVFILPAPSDQPGKLDSAFMILADWSGSALLTPEEVDKERGVILAESRLGKGANDRMMKIWLPAMLNGSKYAERLPIGKDSIIEHFDQNVLKQFYHDWYRPDLEAVIVVGDMPVADAEKMIIEKFGTFKSISTRERPLLFDVKPYEQSRAMVLTDNEAAQTTIMITGNPHLIKPVITNGDYLNRIVENLCNQMLNQRFDDMRTSADAPFVYAFGYTGGWVRGYQNFSLNAFCGIEQLKKATYAIVNETMRVKKNGFSDAEISRGKASMLSRFEQRYNERDKEESGNLTWELVSNFLEKDAVPGIEWEYNFLKNAMNLITPEALNAAYLKMDIDSKYFALITAKAQPGLPSDSQFKAWVDSALMNPVEALKEHVIPSSLIEKEPVAGKILHTERNKELGTTTYTLSNNAIVCIKPTDFKNDEILLKGQRQGGFGLYTGVDYQSAQWCNNAVEEMGYGNFSSADLGKFMAGKNASVMPTVVEYSEYIDGKSAVKDLETMFQLLYLKSTSPRKDGSAFESFISRSKQSLQSVKQNPQYLFLDSAYNTYYQGNKRAHIIESAIDFDHVNIDHAIEFYNQRFGNQAGMYYTIIGNFNEDQIVPLIEKYIGGMPGGVTNLQFKDIGLFPVQGKKSFTLHKGKEPQAMLMHYIEGEMPYNVDDNFNLYLLNDIINNKVIEIIREGMSAIYGGGIGGSLDKFPRDQFLIESYFPCSPENIEKVDSAFLSIIESIKLDGGITEADLQQVREPALEHNEVNLKENTFWLNSLQSAHLYGTDPMRIITKEKRLRAITVGQLVETARKFYTMSNVFKAEWLPEVVK